MHNVSFVKQTEVNSGGGIRISVYKQTYNDDGVLISEAPLQIMIGPFDDIDMVIRENNDHLAKIGFPPIDPVELDLPIQLRAAAHAHPAVKERMMIEAEAIARRRAAEEAARVAEKAAVQKATEEAEKRASAAEKEFNDRVAAAVAKALAKS